jgi:hypothetical protein
MYAFSHKGKQNAPLSRLGVFLQSAPVELSAHKNDWKGYRHKSAMDVI